MKTPTTTTTTTASAGLHASNSPPPRCKLPGEGGGKATQNLSAHSAVQRLEFRGIPTAVCRRRQWLRLLPHHKH